MNNPQSESVMETNGKMCIYCYCALNEFDQEALECEKCSHFVHLKCLKRGTVPGGLYGDIFFEFTCQNCSNTNTESFVRDKMPWLQAIVLVLYHMQNHSPGLARKGYFHWKIHIASFIDKHWDIIFKKDFKRKKKWIGTVSGTLSHYSPYFFKSGTSLFNDQGWWTLTYPKLTPNIIVQLNAELMLEKQKLKEFKGFIDEAQLLKDILANKPHITDDMLNSNICLIDPSMDDAYTEKTTKSFKNKPNKLIKGAEKKKRQLLPLPTNSNVLPQKRYKKPKLKSNGDQAPTVCDTSTKDSDLKSTVENLSEEKLFLKPAKFLDPMCHYNTSLSDLSRTKGLTMKARLTGGIRKEPILSPYTSIYLPPYIRRDITMRSPWLQLMDELQSKVNHKTPNWILPNRHPIDFVYVQPEHIPTINSLCNQFFWTVTDTLRYPDFSCIVLYRRLIIGFAFIIPDVKFNESYISFIFTRPGWRNCGIAKFMLYHLIQTSSGRDITLHVSISNPALFLYQKFGFKVECVVLDFYDRYMRDDTRESKNAFFCRLER